MSSIIIKKYAPLFLIIILIGIFYISTIREGHNWDGDFSMYILHAKNITERAPYATTPYIFNPEYASLGPESYPVIFPLILAPVYKFAGINLRLMKIEIVIFFLLFLMVLYFILIDRVCTYPYIIAIIGSIGLNPFFWDFKDNVLSEIPFIFFLYLGFFLINRWKRHYYSGITREKKLMYAIITGIVISLAYGTRGIGVLLLVLLFYEAMRSKRFKLAIISAILFIFFMILQNLFAHKDTVYLKEFSISPRLIVSHLYWYIKGMPALWDNGYIKILRDMLFLVFSILSITGYLLAIRKEMGILELFPLLYAGCILIWPAFCGIRFFIPLMPLYIYYGFEGLRFYEERTGIRIYLPILLSIILVSYIAKYTTMDFGPIREGVSNIETIKLFNFIKENTNPDDVFIYKRPRILALYTGRKASAYHRPKDDRALLDYFYRIKARYAIVGKPFENGEGIDKDYLNLFISAHKDNFEEIYSNNDFKVYRIKTK